MKQLSQCLLTLILFLVLSGVVAETSSARIAMGLLSDDEERFELMKAAGKGDQDTVLALIEKGAEVNEKGNVTGRTPLIYAAGNGHINIVRILIAKGANVDIIDMGGMSALMYAAEDGHTDIVQTLLEKGANVNKHKSSSTALLCAAKSGHTKIVQILIKKGANVNQGVANGETALMAAAGNGYTDIVRILLAQGANVNANAGGTALMFAAQGGYTDIVRVLLEKGADVNATDSAGYTALSLAEAGRHAGAVRILKMAIGQTSQKPQKSTKGLSLPADDIKILNQLQPPATEDEKALYQKAKSKNAIKKFIATRKYIRLVKARFGNKDLSEEDLKRAPAANNPNIVFEYTLDYSEQLLIFNIQIAQSIEAAQQ